MGKIAFFFAGQGAQYPGMGKSLYACSKAAKEVFDTAERLRPGTMAQCFEGSAEELKQTINTQPCLFTLDYACAAALKEAGIQADMIAGFSLGELAAIAFAGVLTFEDAFALVRKRAEYMQACGEKYPGSMGAALRLPAAEVESICKSFTSVYPVNYNCADQTVVSGPDDQLQAFAVALQAAGGRFMPLKVSGSFHSPFMKDAAEKLYVYLQTVTLRPPAIPVYANATARPYGEDIAGLLATQIEQPVLLQKTVENMVQDGMKTAIELGAGKTLCGLINKIGGVKHILNVQDEPSLHETLHLLQEDHTC